MNDNFVLNMEKAFARVLPTDRVVVYESVDSTNTRAKLFALDGADSASFFIAKKQSEGRGRRGRSFESSEGGLYISYLSFLKIPASELIMLTVFSSVALCEVIEETTNLKPKIKWVNDVFVGNKKLAGILTEGEFSEDCGSFKYAVVGIGVNLCKTDFSEVVKSIATDVETECGVRVDIYDFAARLAKKLKSFDQKLIDQYLTRYRERSFVLGKRIKVLCRSEEFFAEALRIESNGNLTVKLDTGEIKSLCSAEVSIITE